MIFYYSELLFMPGYPLFTIGQEDIYYFYLDIRSYELVNIVHPTNVQNINGHVILK